jgi:hypothetical protein
LANANRSLACDISSLACEISSLANANGPLDSVFLSWKSGTSSRTLFSRWGLLSAYIITSLSECFQNENCCSYWERVDNYQILN